MAVASSRRCEYDVAHDHRPTDAPLRDRRRLPRRLRTSNSIDGTIAGRTFTVAEALSGLQNNESSGTVTIVLGSLPGLCDALQSSDLIANDDILVLEAGTSDAAGYATGAPMAGDDFPVVSQIQGAGPFALVGYYQVDAKCNGALTAAGTGGMIAITAGGGSDDDYSGNGTVHLSTGETVSLEFGATACSALWQLSSTTSFTLSGCE